MRVGLGVSLAAHLALISLGLFAFPDAKPFSVDHTEALPVDLVPISEVTDLLAGSKTAKPKPDEKPQPKPQAKADRPDPKPAEKPAPKPIEAVKEPTPRPTPKVEEKPKPEETKVASVPPEPEPEPDPAPLPDAQPEKAPEATPQEAAPALDTLPKMRPTPPKDIKPPKPAETKPAPEKPVPEKPKVTQKPEPKRDFRPDDIAALLDKRDPTGGGDPDPSPDPQTFGAREGKAEAAMTQSEIEALKARLYQCWNPPIGVRQAGGLRVTVAISLQPDGTLAAPPRPVGGGFDELSRVAMESAIRAVHECAPYDILPPEKYSLWRDIEFTFDPSEMLGG
ncbi:cell envelope integrity protein TolA [Afifella marina]|uniref:Cell division and transport-associated protein TolA n=1 Tax=Afifella marina DSM 2698 TaxID=1120955 RepID=A0A1G5P4E0_AFIMA|nr:cell envelope integrity protein TolA [Afifella marina]MBK1625063.1 hypothetical protein [Afifella marina DSM 2698]MBK1628767.1 hypothetical protein [Afifella marina]MBK5918425.1 hypothetical protein [Afifella marina]RAI19517.1 hypothetical protein CH311_11925 [Afifella marina DSM 2698]SCZ44367.1 Cell division and transport-associated protein TolA [Afifella marina DSM 2698]